MTAYSLDLIYGSLGAMTLDPSAREGLKTADQRFLKIIEEQGWCVTIVAPRVGEEGQLFAYSTGLYHTYEHPEIILFNLESKTLHNAINAVGKRVQAGEIFQPKKAYQGIFDDRECQFRVLHGSHYREYLGWSIWFYQNLDFPVLQAFWPDEENHFPWDEYGDGWIRQTQPLLYEELPSA